MHAGRETECDYMFVREGGMCVPYVSPYVSQVDTAARGSHGVPAGDAPPKAQCGARGQAACEAKEGAASGHILHV